MVYPTDAGNSTDVSRDSPAIDDGQIRGPGLKFSVPFGFALFLFSISWAQDNTYVGSARCQSCHAKAYSIWVASAHARAQASLGEERKNELRCLFCHATDAQMNLTNYNFANVQCEACHGPGSRHISLALNAEDKNAPVGGLEPSTEIKCRGCHSDVRSPNMRPFRYDAALQKIRHW
jgi:hypothetical protein